MPQGNGDIQVLAELINSRFDRMEERYDGVTNRLSELDKTAVTRDEFQMAMKGMLDEFSRMTTKIEGIFVNMAAQEVKWATFDKRLNDIEQAKGKKQENLSTFKIFLYTGLISAVVGAVVSAIATHLFK